MISCIKRKQPTLAYRILSAFIALTFVLSVIVPPTPIWAQAVALNTFQLPLPGTMLSLTPGFNPPLVKGITIHPDNPLKFDFLVSPGDDNLNGIAFREESKRLIKYFLASLTVPDNELWVNLSPYEQDRIISQQFGQTEMGRDMLAQDYILKQLTASLMYPEDQLGKKFWDRVYTKAYEQYGTTEIPMNTFNKIWIVPEKAVVYEHGQTAFVVESHLKVMLEEDYIALKQHNGAVRFGLDQVTESDAQVISGVSSEVVREILIPEIEKEVNEGKIFTQLRQIYNSVILATWYKDNLKESLLGQIYVDKGKTKGVHVDDVQVNQKIYDQYVEAFKKGVYNYIKEDYDPVTKQMIPRKYFSGGFNVGTTQSLRKDVTTITQQQAEGASSPVRNVEVDLLASTRRNAEAIAVAEQAFGPKETLVSSPVKQLSDAIETASAIPHKPEDPNGFFSVNKAIKTAFDMGKTTELSVDSEYRTQLLTYLTKLEKTRSSDVDIKQIKAMLEGTDIKIVMVEDTKNGSPALIMRTSDDYRTVHSGILRKTIYVGKGIVEGLSDEHRNVFLARALLALSKSIDLYSPAVSSYDETLVQAKLIADRFEKNLVGNDLDHSIRQLVAQFLEEYYQKLLTRNVVWDWESSILTAQQGKNLVGGKSYQAARYWADDTEGNLRSFAGTTTASVRFLQNDPSVLPKIYEIMESLDTSDEKAREQAYTEIRKLILAVEIPEDIRKSLLKETQQLARETGIPEEELLLAIRSAGKAEDIQITVKELQGISLGANAGQHDTFLGELIGELVQRWKEDVASLYTDRVLDYRDGMMVLTSFGKIFENSRADAVIQKLSASSDSTDRLVAKAFVEKNIKIISSIKLLRALRQNGFTEEAQWVREERKRFTEIENIAMGVTVMPMADAEISFVAFGHDLTAEWTAMNFHQIPETEHLDKGRVVTITTNYKLGESIVQGVATLDTFLVHIFTDEDGEHFNILSSQLGTKTVQTVYTAPVKQKLGLTDETVQEYLNLIETGQAQREALNLSDEASFSQTAEVLRRLVDVDVDQTASKITPEDIGLFKYTREELKLLVHLLKMALEIDSRTRTMFTDVPEELRNKFSATHSQVISIAREFVKKSAGYGHLVDMEGTVGRNFGKENMAVTVQRRPSNVDGDVKHPKIINIRYTYVRQSDVKARVAEKKKIGDTGLIEGEELIQGIATRNAFSGEIYKIDRSRNLADQFEEIKRLADSGKQIIIRTKETTPDYISILKYRNVMGVIADTGGGTSHAAVVSRELGIATVVGIEKWLHKLESAVGAQKAQAIITYINTTGNVVTVDANISEKSGYGTVYAGELPISTREIVVDIARLPEIYTKIGYIMGLPHPMLVMSKIAQYEGYSGVVLQRGEFAYAEENVNPRFGIAFDNMLVYDYLKSQENSANLDSLSPPERKAQNMFVSHLKAREALRARGQEIPLDETEKLIKSFKDRLQSSSRFLVSLDSHAKSDLLAIRTGAIALKEVSRITEQITGYLSYASFFESIHGGAISTMAAANSQTNNTVVYRSIDFKKNEARELIGSVIFDPVPETATMLGERGARWLLQPENQGILKSEVRLLLRQVVRGYTNLGFMFPFVSTPDELDRLLTLLEDEEKTMSQELNRPVYLREVGQMIELPSNVVQAEEFLKVLTRHNVQQKDWFRREFQQEIKRKSFFSFGTNDLTQTTLGADRDNPAMSTLFNEAHPFVIESIRHVVNMSRKYDVKCGLCGQAIVNLVNTDPEAAEEIFMLLGSTGGYAGTDYLGTVPAIVRSASATLKHGTVKNPADKDRLVIHFSSKLVKGAAARPLFHIRKKDELARTYIGDFAFINDGITPEDLNFTGDEILRDMISRLGAVIYANDALDDIMTKIRTKLRVPVIKITPKISVELRKVTNGSVITIDFTHKKIYEGKQPIEIEVPDTASEINIPSPAAEGSVQPAQLGAAISSSEFYKETGQHPLSYLSDEGRRTEFKERLTAFIKSQTVQGGSFIYETLDLQSHELLALAGHDPFIKEAETNPPLGFFGLYALVEDPQFRDLFKLEMEVIKSLQAEGYKIAIQFNSVRVPGHLKAAVGVLKEAGINLQTIKLGFNSVWPGNYLFLAQFLAELIPHSFGTFVTIDERKLAQAYLAADLHDNKRVRDFYTYEVVKDSLAYPERMMTAVAAGLNVPIRKISFNEITLSQRVAFNRQVVKIAEITRHLDEANKLLTASQGRSTHTAVLAAKFTIDLRHAEDIGLRLMMGEDYETILVLEAVPKDIREAKPITDIAKTAGISPDRAKEILRQLVETGKVAADGKSFYRTENSASSPVQDASYSPILPEAIEETQQTAVSSPISEPVGGIDLNPALLDLEIRRDDNGIPLPMNLQPVEVMDIEGFLPVIISITPVTNLSMLLGFNIPDHESKPFNSANSNSQATPADLSFVDKYRGKYIREHVGENISI